MVRHSTGLLQSKIITLQFITLFLHYAFFLVVQFPACNFNNLLSLWWIMFPNAIKYILFKEHSATLKKNSLTTLQFGSRERHNVNIMFLVCFHCYVNNSMEGKGLLSTEVTLAPEQLSLFLSVYPGVTFTHSQQASFLKWTHLGWRATCVWGSNMISATVTHLPVGALA